MLSIPLALGLLGPLGILLGAVALIGKVLAVFSALTRGDLRGGQKLLWTALIIIVPLVWFIYFVLGRRRTAAFLR